ncbi:MAG: quinone oxidoreductase [Actinomycetota bacterium]|nr:quinone oxidoreductase [Actinomycetota bacterium]
MTDTVSTHSLVVPRTGDSSVLSVQECEVAAPGPGELRVEVAATGVNFIEVYQRQGVYPLRLPFVLGSEGAGTVESVGDGVDLRVGERVAWAAAPGSAAGFVRMPASAAVPVPDGLALETAAAAMLQGITAHYLVTSTYAVQPGDTVLAHAVAGGVGQLLVQMVKARGARLVGTAGSAAKVDKALALGADHVIDYSGLDTDALAAAVREANDGEGVHVVYDGVGRTTFDASLKALRRRGLLVLFGAASGQVPPFAIQRLNAGGSLFLTRPTMGDYIATRQELTWRAGEVLGALASGALTIEVGGRYPLVEAAKAYDDLEGRRTTGKLLLLP